MGSIQSPQPVKLVVALLTAVPACVGQACDLLVPRYGPIDYSSPLLPFTSTTYYEPEMGPHLQRQFVAFERLIHPEDLAQTKTYTNAVEKLLGVQQKRRINLDPGYMTMAKFILATTKDQSHRIYLSKGIYAEITCNYIAGRWQPNPWTYPDYRSEAYLNILDEIRIILKTQLRLMAGHSTTSAISESRL